MAPDSKHRKDPTDPHLKFMTRSRRLIHVTRDHMNSINRISAEIHELSRSILADNDDLLTSRSNLELEESDLDEDEIGIQRERSFDVSNQLSATPNPDPIDLSTRLDMQPENFQNDIADSRSNLPKPDYQRFHEKMFNSGNGITPKVPSKFLNIPYKLKATDRYEQSFRKGKYHNKISFPTIPRAYQRNRDTVSARIYQIHVAQTPLVQQKTFPRVACVPKDAHRAKPTQQPRSQLGTKMAEKLTAVVTKGISKPPAPTAKEKSSSFEKSKKLLPVLLKPPLPVYRAPTQIMQPPGNAARVDVRLPRVTDARDTEAKEHSSKLKSQNIKLPEIHIDSPCSQGGIRLEHVGSFQRLGASEHDSDDRRLYEVSGCTRKHEPKPSSSRIGDRRKTLKRKETVILPKINPSLSSTPSTSDQKNKKQQQHFHRPSYLITSPVPTSRLAPTASYDSCLSISPMPNINQLSLTHRQTVLLSGSPTNFLTTSRPGSMLQDTPVQGNIPRLPRLVTSDLSPVH